MKITKLSDLAVRAKKMEKKTAVAVVEAQDGHTLESVIEAARDGIIAPMLIGREGEIASLLKELGAQPDLFNIIPSGSTEESLRLAVEAVHEGRAGALMKGNLQSGDFLRAVMNRENDLLSGAMLSVAGFFETTGYHKLFAISDMVLNTYPDLEGKKAITQNAVGMLCALGYENPKVAVLAAVETLNPKMPETVDADNLKQMNGRGEIKNCIIEGPISFDLATHPDAARIKGYDSPVAGDADLLIVPDIASGNILAKCLTGMAGAQTAGTVLGAKIPVILTSRSAEAADKYYSIALAACIGGGVSTM